MEFRRLHKGFGAEVFGFDATRSATVADIEVLRAAYDEYQMLLFRSDRWIEPDRQIKIAGWFGPVMDAEGKACTVLHNDDAGGRNRLPFHADFSYTDTPIKGITLQAIELPPVGTATAFVSGIHAWATLAPDLQNLLMSMTLRHRHLSDAVPEWGEFRADHPVRLMHPRTGRPILYVTEYHAQRIHELDPGRSAEVLGRLFAHLYAPENVYVHRWERYDLMLWDNLVVQHARPERAEPADGVRAMQRVALCEVPLAAIIEHAMESGASAAAPVDLMGQADMEFRRLHEGFGAEVIGFDVLGDVAPEEIDALRATYDEYQLLVIRCDRRVTPERQIEITGWFGPVMNAFGGQWGVLNNEQEGTGGRERLPFHLDYSFTETPFKGITLQATDLPPAGTTTEFVSNIHNWATLTPDLQHRLAPMTLQHRQPADPNTPELLATHPVRLTRPQTGQPILFVTQYHAHRIHELEADQSDQLLGELFDHMYAPERVYEHRWKPYDFLIWDNLAIQHPRPKTAELSDGVRALQRVTISDLSLDEILKRARQQAEQRQQAA